MAKAWLAVYRNLKLGMDISLEGNSLQFCSMIGFLKINRIFFCMGESLQEICCITIYNMFKSYLLIKFRD